MAAALLAVLALLLGLVVVVLVTPLQLDLSLHKQAGFSFAAALRPCGGYGPRIMLRRRKTPAAPAKPARKRRQKRGGRRFRPVRAAAAALRLAAEVLHRVHIRKLAAEGTFGTGDPAETGQLYGLLAPLSCGLARGGKLQLDLTPDFTRAVLRGRAVLELTVVPAALLGPAVRFGWRAFGPVR